MRNRRMASRLLALALTALMLVSCFVALPAMAADATSGKTVLWGYDFASFGTQSNASLKDNYFSKNDVFALDTSATGATSLSGGMLSIGGATYIRNTNTTGEDPNKDFFNLMYGFHEGYNTAGSKYFMEMDFIKMKDSDGSTGSIAPRSDTSASWSYYDENGQPVEGSGTLYTDFGGGNGSSLILCKAGGQSAPLLEVAANGMAYTRDNRGTYADVLSYGGVYYKNEQGEKVYLPESASVTDLNLSDRCIKDPSKAYQLVTGVTYRLGVAFRLAGVGADGKNTLVATVYIKKAGAANWETCIGNTTYYYYPVGYPGYKYATEANDCIQLNDNSYSFRIGGKWEIYSYTCNGTDHLNATATSDPVDETRKTCTCISCGKSWAEREIDGLRYVGTSYGNACEGTYTVWLPTNGVGAPFADSEYTTLGVGHKYSTTNGKCSVCGEYAFLEGFEGADVKVEYGTKEDAQPFYNAEEKTWSWPGGGYMTIRNGMLDETSMKPYVYSFDIKIDGAVVKNASSNAYWALMTWQNNGNADNYQNTYLELGATGATEDDDIFLVLVNDRDEKRGIENAIHVFERGKWCNIAVAVNPATPTISVYVDGNFVGAIPNTGITPNTSYTSTIMRMGINTFSGKHYFQYNLRNIKLVKSESDTFYDIVPNNELFSFRYDRYQQASGKVGGKSTHTIGTFSAASALAPTGIYTMEDGTVFGMVENTGYKQFSLYSNTENNKYALSDKKYELKMSFAVPDTADLAGGANLIRLSKFLDSIKSENLKYSGTGQYLAYVKGVNSNSPLYKRDGVTPLTCVRTFTDGIPESLSEVRMIVDEGKNTYSVYVDNELAYYYDKNDVLQPAKDLTMHLNASGITGKTYGQITREDVVAAGHTISTDSMYDCHYARILRSVPQVALEEFSVTVIPDSNVEFVGVQERIDDVNDRFDVRFVVGIDDIYVPGLGFSVEAFVNGSSRGTRDIIIDHAYDSLQAGDDRVYAYQFAEGTYLTAFSVTGIDLTGNASDIYAFKVTPYTVDENGQKVNERASRVFKYNGCGVCVGNGKPKEFDPKEFEALTTSPVILELQQKAASAAGDYADFFVYTRCSDPSGRYYVRYRFQYCYSTEITNKTDSGTNIESFRVVAAELVKLTSIGENSLSYDTLHNLLSSGEISLAIKEYEYGQAYKSGEPQFEEDGVTPVMGNSIQDFCGGFHGDEHFAVVDGVDQLFLKADGVSFVPGAVNAIVQCETVTLEETTLLDKWAIPTGSEGQFAKHEQLFTLTDDGMKIDRKVTWLADEFVIDKAYPMMFTLLRVDKGTPICEIVESFDANGISLGKKTFELVNDNQTGELSNANLRQVRFSSATSGISAVAGFSLGENNQGRLSNPYIAYRTAVAGGSGDNKLYIPMAGSTSVQVQSTADGATTTKSKAVKGEVWEISTFYNIDYVKPNN